MQTKLQEYQNVVREILHNTFADDLAAVVKLQEQFRQENDWVAIRRHLPQGAEEAMRWSLAYALLAGGKRIRPVLALATYEICCQQQKRPVDYSKLAPVVLAIEAVHTYSLVHDDLPAMDNDSLRHGLPTAHILWDEAKAILVGDALLTYAFEVLGELSNTDFAAENIIRTVSLLAKFAGREGMVRGQWRDMSGVGSGKCLPQDELLALIREKTACLLQAPLLMAATLCGASQTCKQQLSLFGENLGIAFQIRDDILDTVATTATMGKTVGKDEETGKQTYVTLYGLQAAQADLCRYTDLALQALQNLVQEGYDVSFLEQLAAWLLKREM